MTDLDSLKKEFFDLLDERQKRLYAGLVALEKGHYGVPEANRLFGLHDNTIRQGKEDLKHLSLQTVEQGKIRKPGGGRKKNT